MHDLFKTLLATFAPLRIRNLRIYLSGQAVSLMGTWMQHTAQAWVVWQLTQSEAALGTVGALGALPMLLLSPWGGVWADRLDRRRVLIVTQVIAALLACVMAVLVGSGTIAVWHVYTMAVILGCVAALDFPAQNAFLGDLSGMGEVRKAVVLNAMILQVSRMIGPTMAGWVAGAFGLAPSFWINAASFLAVIGSLMVVRTERARPAANGGKSSPLREFREGLSFIGTAPRIQDLLLFTTLATFFGIANLQIMAAFVGSVLGRGPEALGMLMGASGAGALTGALVVVPLAQRVRRTGRALATATTWAGAAFVAFSLVHWLPGNMLLLFCTGMGIPMVMTTVSGLLQTMAPPAMRARILSVNLMMGFGLQPLSALWVGYGAQWLSAPVAIRINGSVLLVGGLVMLALRRELRMWEPAPARSA